MAHKWFDGDPRQIYEETFHNSKLNNQDSIIIGGSVDREYYDSIPSVSYLLQYERPGENNCYLFLFLFFI